MRLWVDVREIHYGRVAIDAETESEAMAEAQTDYKTGNTIWIGTDCVVMNAVPINTEALAYGQ